MAPLRPAVELETPATEEPWEEANDGAWNKGDFLGAGEEVGVWNPSH